MSSKMEQSTWTIEAHDVVYCVEFSPFHWSSSLLGIGSAESVKVVQCGFKEEYPDVDDFVYENLRQFEHNSRVQSIAWSPETSLAITPKVLRLATAGADMNIRVLTSDMKTDDSIVVCKGHNDYVNSVTFEPAHGKQLASTGDDHTCRVWDLDGTMKACLRLKSAGMAVCWHTDDSGKVMVAQKNGVIRFYNVDKQQPLMSVDCGQSPLMSADWCPGNHLRVGAAAGTSWFIWDISRSSLPHDSNHIHTSGALTFRWARSNSNLFATTGRPKHEIKVTHFVQNQVTFATTLPVGSCASWHSKLAVLATVGSRQIILWKLDIL